MTSLQLPTKKTKISKHQFLFDNLLPRVAVVAPVMAQRFLKNFLTYKKWKVSGFDIELVVTEGEEESIKAFLKEQGLNTDYFKIHTYNPGLRSNAGKAKKAAYDVLKWYLGDPRFMYVLLLDDTVNEIADTKTAESIMISPSKFCEAVEIYAAESPVFGGTVAANRHQRRWNDQERAVAVKEPVAIKGAFIQQAVFFSCRGAPTLRNHFENVDDYVSKMSELTYREVPFGEDIAFQISLYEHGILKEGKSAQFRGISVSRMRHKSATKRPFNELDDASKKALKDMMSYLREQDVLKTDPLTNELTGVAVIPGGPVRIKIEGKPGERSWREAYNYAFPQNKLRNKKMYK